MKKKIVFSTLITLMLSVLIISCSAQKDSSSAQKDTTATEPSVELNISAAASLKEAMADIQTEFKKVKPNVTLTVNFGASGSFNNK